MALVRLVARAFSILLLVSMTAAPAADTSQASKSVDFSLSGRAYTFDLPDDYCIPTGESGHLARTIASLDRRNMTHLTIVPCTELARDSSLPGECSRRREAR